MQWIDGEPSDMTDAEKNMVVTDYATAPEPDNLCPNCGFDALVERGCKVICTHCKGLIQSCSE